MSESITRRQVMRVLGIGSGLAVLPVFAQNQKALQEGYDYRLVKPSQPVESAKKFEVVEFFWYGCPHCFHFEPVLEPWVKKLPTDVAFRRIHVAFRDDFVPHQRLYYSLEALGKLPELHKKAFDAFHVQNRPMNNAEQIADWASQNGLDRKSFLDTYNSFSIVAKCSRGKQESDAWKINGVPALGFQGKYLTSASIIGGPNEKVIEVADRLLDEIRKGKK